MEKASDNENRLLLKELINKELEHEFNTTNNKEIIKKLIQAKYYVLADNTVHKIFASEEINKDITKYLPDEELDDIHICEC